VVKVEKVPQAAPEFRCPGPQPLFKGIYPSNQKQFLSTVQTGTGAAQNIAHGLGAAPAGVLVVPVDNSAIAAGGPFTITEGTHSSTNVVVTVTLAAKFKVLAWL
jgi:hypothetical protein